MGIHRMSLKIGDYVRVVFDNITMAGEYGFIRRLATEEDCHDDRKFDFAIYFNASHPCLLYYKHELKKII